jgi:hypothetical protein
MSIEAEMIAEALRPSGGSASARRNRLIKRALAREFGWENVSVTGDRGTAYGWVNIRIRVKKPHGGECDWRCRECRVLMDRIRERVWEILGETGLDGELYTYYDDMGNRRYECSIDVRLEP